MTAILLIHPENPQPRLIAKAVDILKKGGVIVYPTDSGYALGCEMGNKTGVQAIRQIRELPEDHHFSLLCRDISEISNYARISNPIFRLLKSHTPGSYTFILPATREVPGRLLHPKKQTIGIRVPDHPVALALLEAMNHPIMSVSLILPGASEAATMEEISEQLQYGRVDLILDAGPCGNEPTTIVDLTLSQPKILRSGKGDIAPFEGA